MRWCVEYELYDPDGRKVRVTESYTRSLDARTAAQLVLVHDRYVRGTVQLYSRADPCRGCGDA